MALNNYFEKYNNNEGNLLEDLVQESIQVFGHEVSYLPRTQNNLDNIFGEATASSFESAYPVEVYIKTTDGFEGEGAFVGRFGLEIREQVTFSMSQRTWKGLGLTTRPLEGDLIWFDTAQKMFEIQFVEHQAIFYQLGRLPVYDLSCEFFEYSSEDIDTGIPEIDAVEADSAYSVEYGYSANSGVFSTNETIIGGMSGASAKVLKLRDVPGLGLFVRVTNIVGSFTPGENIIGQTSNETAQISTVTKDFAEDEQAKNVVIEKTANGIIDFTEGNPFSEGSF
tara:strand:+ start:89 stop:931 length:843 start_codon:yes stop_codon:yes gene_type:complete